MSKRFIITFCITVILLLITIHFYGNQMDDFCIRNPGTPQESISLRGLAVIGALIFLGFVWMFRKEER